MPAADDAHLFASEIPELRRTGERAEMTSKRFAPVSTMKLKRQRRLRAALSPLKTARRGDAAAAINRLRRR